MTRTVWDAITPRRLVTAALIALAVVLVVVGFQRTSTPRQADNCPVANTPILQLSPCPNDSVPGQDKIGVDMQQGWQVDLTLDGTPVPKDQMQIQGGLYLFQPRPGADIGALRPGAHTAEILYYRNLADESSGRIFRWSFRTT